MSSHQVSNQLNLVPTSAPTTKNAKGLQESIPPTSPTTSNTQPATTATIPTTTTTSAVKLQQPQILTQNSDTADPSSTVGSSTTQSTSAPSTAMNGSPISVSAASDRRTPNTGNHNQHHHHNNNNNNHSHHHGHNQHQQNLSKTNLYIRGLQNNTSDQDLYNMCIRFGPILSTKAIMDKATGTCKGYGFVEFTSTVTAELAVQELTNSGIQAQMAKISPLYSSNHHNHHHHHHNYNHNNSNNHHHGNNNNNSSSPLQAGSNNAISHSSNSNVNLGQQQHYHGPNNKADPTNLYIANLPPNMSEQELENLLSKYGSVVSTRILRDESNNTRGVGFARMDSRDKCEQIIEHLNGRSYKGWKEPLLVKFADGGNKKRHHQHNNHHHQHHNSGHHQHHKVHQDDRRWQDNGGGNANDSCSTSSFEHQSNIPHSNRLSELTMMSTMSYTRMQPGFPTNVAPGGTYPTPLSHQASPPQWIHHGGPGQPPFVISQQMIQAGGMGPSNQAAAAALHYGHIPQLTSQMQGLQITHSGAPVGAGYLPPQHQWSTLWAHPIPQQAQPSIRLPAHHMQPPTQQPAPQQHHQQQQQTQTQHSPQSTPIQLQQQPNPPQSPPVNENSMNKVQVSMPL